MNGDRRTMSSPASTTLRVHDIVVGYNGTPDADVAAAWAARVAARQGIAVTALIVTGLVDTPRGHRLPEAWWREMEDRARARLTGCGAPSVRVERRPGPIAAAFADAASTAGMVVLGTRGDGRVAETVLGAVSHVVARSPGCPVVIVRPVRHPGSRRVVVGVDRSDASLRALDFACRYAALDQDTVAVVRAWKSGDVPVDKHGAGQASSSSSMLREERLMKEVVELAHVRYSCLSVEAELIATDAGQALVDASARADLVVVGTRGLNAVERAVLGSVSRHAMHRGSVSRHVMHHAQCPVAIVH